MRHRETGAEQATQVHAAAQVERGDELAQDIHGRLRR
jgi:hypothetical protein